jgi:nucleoside phosphorylase
MSENLMADVEQVALAAEAEAAGIAPAATAVTLPAGTLKRVQALLQQQDAAMKQLAQNYLSEINKVLLYALEAMDVTGSIQSVDPVTGVVTLEPVEQKG